MWAAARIGRSTGVRRRISTCSSHAAKCMPGASSAQAAKSSQDPSANGAPISMASCVSAPKTTEARRNYRSSVDPSETAKFAALAHTWWDLQGPHKALHAMNPVRMSFIRAALCRHFGKDPSIARPLEGLRIVDVGCGGGLACEPLARMGGLVTGIDAAEENITVASKHAALDPVTASIQYRHTTAECLAKEHESFDVVVALEVIEHVADPSDFCSSLSELARNGGIVVVSTINRSIIAYGLAIFAVEYLLKWIPKGTHNWSKFVSPEELSVFMRRSSVSMEEVVGMMFNPVANHWFLSSNTVVNYIGYGVKH